MIIMNDGKHLTNDCSTYVNMIPMWRPGGSGYSSAQQPQLAVIPD